MAYKIFQLPNLESANIFLREVLNFKAKYLIEYLKYYSNQFFV